MGQPDWSFWNINQIMTLLCSKFSKGSPPKIKLKVLQMPSKAFHHLSSFPTDLSLAHGSSHCGLLAVPWTSRACSGLKALPCCSPYLDISSLRHLHDHPLISFKSMLKWLCWQTIEIAAHPLPTMPSLLILIYFFFFEITSPSNILCNLLIY